MACGGKVFADLYRRTRPQDGQKLSGPGQTLCLGQDVAEMDPVCTEPTPNRVRMMLRALTLSQ